MGFSHINSQSCQIIMRIFFLLAAVLSTSLATSPLYSSPHHVHADSGRGGHGPNHVNPPFPSSLLELCDGIVSHEHTSGPTLIGQKVFRVGAGVVCVDQRPGATVAPVTEAPATDAPTDAPEADTNAPEADDAATDETPADDTPADDETAGDDAATDAPAGEDAAERVAAPLQMF